MSTSSRNASSSGSGSGSRNRSESENGSATVINNNKKSMYALPDIEEDRRLALAERVRLCRSCVEEVVDNKDARLEDLLERDVSPVCYDGFEPSGRMHIAQGLMKSIIVNRMTRSGFTYLFWIADWFALLNQKMGGDSEAIETVGKYFIEVWRATGMDMQRVKFLWASKEFEKRHSEYWPLVIDIMTQYSVAQMMRCSTIMGRQQGEDLPASAMLYAAMQCADVFFLGVDVCQLGLDQRKVNMRAREFADSKRGKERGLSKPIVMSHHMIRGLKEGQAKMSKSDPNSAIFMEDDEKTVCRKIRKAFCPPRVTENNPVCDYLRYIVFPKETDEGRLPVRLADGAFVFSTYEEFATHYENGEHHIHPAELKKSLCSYLNAYMEPVRKHFRENQDAKELLERVKSFKQNSGKKIN